MASTRKLRHLVLVKFNDNTSAADIKRLEDEFRTMATVKIPQVKEYEWGINVGKENLDHGYTHCFVLTFASEEDRNIYLDHKDHMAFVNSSKPHMAAITVLDFWASG